MIPYKGKHNPMVSAIYNKPSTSNGWLLFARVWQNITDSKGPRIHVDKISIQREEVGLMSKWLRPEGPCYRAEAHVKWWSHIVYPIVYVRKYWEPKMGKTYYHQGTKLIIIYVYIYMFLYCKYDPWYMIKVHVANHQSHFFLCLSNTILLSKMVQS